MDVEELGFGPLSELGPMEKWPVGRLFLACTRNASQVMWRLVEQHGVSPAGFFLLRVLVGEDGLPAGEVAKRLMTSPATITSVVDTLQRDGHVERRRDHRDRRVVRLHVSDSGRRLIHETGRAMAGDFKELFELADTADDPAVRRYLLGLLDRFDAFTKGDRS
jgi:DNA-binding MarR family transcriptional regulator